MSEIHGTLFLLDISKTSWFFVGGKWDLTNNFLYLHLHPCKIHGRSTNPPLTYPPPEIAGLNKGLLYNHWFPLIRPSLLNPYESGGGYVARGGGWLNSRCQPLLKPETASSRWGPLKMGVFPWPKGNSELGNHHS